AVEHARRRGFDGRPALERKAGGAGIGLVGEGLAGGLALPGEAAFENVVVGHAAGAPERGARAGAAEDGDEIGAPGRLAAADRHDDLEAVARGERLAFVPAARHDLAVALDRDP